MSTDADEGRSTESNDDAAHVLDVRTMDDPPFEAIMTALADLPEDGTLVLVNSFEPEPLYGVLSARGFTFETTREADDEWRVTVERG